ncbi:MAG: S1 RNA-binding domain-containing protein [Promicromonosporaceae bacterium]|nr:S1 RNA-binding domain-containing protein [Promicromonosporaceae bacterium]
MTGTLEPGDVLDVTVVRVTPFGVLVQTDAGVPGLVRAARADVGATLRVSVTDYDAEKSRFAAQPA